MDESDLEIGGSAAVKRAEMFNEHGLLHGTTPIVGAVGGGSLSSYSALDGVLGTAPSAQDSNAATRIVPLPMAQAEGVSELSTRANPSSGLMETFPGQDISSGDRPSSARAASVSVATVATALRQSGTSVRGIAAKAGAAPATAIRRLAPLLAEQLGPRAAIDAQVTLQAGEGGMAVIARAGELSPEERRRLHDEIGELLARHGIAEFEIRLNGEVERPVFGKEIRACR